MEQTPRQKTKISNNQLKVNYGSYLLLLFFLFFLVSEVIFLLRQLTEKYMTKRENLHMVFIDLEKAYEKDTYKFNLVDFK